jgi:alpha-galactosidase
VNADTVIAARFVGEVDMKGLPPSAAWLAAMAVRFDADWQGRNADSQRATEVRLLWTYEILYLRFEARYRSINVFPDSESDGRRDQLWDCDVCEVFLQTEPPELRRYKEFEVAPNGMWIDLDIAPGGKRDLQSGLRRWVDIDEQNKRWCAVLALPMKGLVQRFEPSAVWQVNFYRVEGAEEPRFYSAWRPTYTAKPNFHVPEAFGRLLFATEAEDGSHSS